MAEPRFVERAVPTLAELVADPFRARDLAPDEAGAFLIALAAVEMALSLVALAPRAEPRPVAPENAGALLTVGQAAEVTQMSCRQLYNAARRADWRPFVVRINARTLRFREAGLRRWLMCQTRQIT